MTQQRVETFRCNPSTVAILSWWDLQRPAKFKAHMEFGEVRKSTPEEIEKHEQEIAAQKALDAIENEKRQAARAAKEAAEAEEKAKE